MLKINGHSLTIPIIQGGMGVGISLGGLCGAVAKAGGMGVISSANSGYREPDFYQNANAANLRALVAEIAKAKEIAQGCGLVGVNVMVATRQYAEAVKTAIAAGVDAVVCGAGLPLDLPELAGKSSVLLAPIVSGGRAAGMICRLWDRRYGRIPDFVVVEGAKAGGHLGFKLDELANPPSLFAILAEVKAALAPFAEKYGRHIPIFVGGGIFDGMDTKAALDCGADGVQVATRFICTPECDASEEYKQILLAAKAEDVQIVQSPVGMPGRALKSPLIQRIAESGRIAPKHCSGCITTCKPADTPYCITEALIAAAKGDRENGLFFCGSNVGRMTKMESVADVLADLVAFI